MPATLRRTCKRTSPVRVALLPLLITVVAIGVGLRSYEIVQRLLDGESFQPVRQAVAAQAGSDRPEELPTPGEQPEQQPGDVTNEEAAAAAAAESVVDPVPDPDLAEAEPIVLDEDSLSRSELELLQSLAERRSELDRRSRQIGDREALLRATEARVDAKIVELTELRRTIEDLLDMVDEAEEQQLKSLVTIYESMKSKDAARIFDSLEMEVLLRVLERMNARKTAPILADMQADRAREVTRALAERRQLGEQGDG